MTETSALYAGAVVHRRTTPRVHALRYRCFWLVLDLDELPALSARLRLFSHNGANLFSLHDRDHGDGSATPLRTQVERHLAAGIDIDGGQIRLLCMPRTLGYAFNPLSVYFCHRRDGALAAILYEVHNTFGERHSYLIPVEAAAKVVRQSCDKRFFVSPFMDMDLRYDFRVVPPGERVVVGIRARTGPATMITASLAADRRDLDDGTLMRAFFSYPALTAKVIAAIHWEALRLVLKGVRLQRRPAPPERPLSIASPHIPRNAE
ncbi:DUF1365 family protein [Xanthobacteraceae bacterium Astr-EGSB]|uniref:DUF1365 domain-containing protein n=1 Tax=Astrobacterium formosum TaxID=3069710 RepID=UPI0027B4C172|nr:DUF1365 family protein [Xanthobacteraceae bacterium Astr-EGSB]